MYAEAERQQRILPPNRKMLIALLFSAIAHAVAITLVAPSSAPAPEVVPLRVVLSSAPPLVTPPPVTIPEHAVPIAKARPEPAEKAGPPPETLVRPESPPKPAPKPAIEKITKKTPQRRPGQPAKASPGKPRPAAEKTTVLAVPSPTPSTAVVTAESRKVEYLYNPPPDYPPRARRLGLEGEVLIRTRVLPSGESDQLVLKRSSGYALLDEAAMEAVRKWRFRPARRGDKQIISWVEIPVRFRLER
jgi:protein TonB